MDEIDVDLLVAGGGVAGVMAAVAAARNGLSVALVEPRGFLGGTGTAAMVSTFCGFYTSGEKRVQVIKGLAQELIERLQKVNGVLGPIHRDFSVIIYDNTALKLALDDIVSAEKNIKIMLHTRVSGIEKNGEAITGSELTGNSGNFRVKANYYIDATGDGSVATMAGVPSWRDADRTQPGSMMFRMGNVDVGALYSLGVEGIQGLAKEADSSGEFDLPRVDGNIIPMPPPKLGQVVVAFSRVSVDGTDSESVSRAELEGRRQVREIVRFLKAKVFGFKDSYLDEIAPSLGIRETRRIMGQYQLTEQDVLGAAKFEDAVVKCAWPVEYHPPGQKTTELKFLPGDEYYEIPYRCLLPVGINNLMLAGRCLSATSAALASARVMAPCMAMGQAAGTAAALARESNVTFNALDVKKLQSLLRSQGADI